jgi:hypothetical protein
VIGSPPPVLLRLRGVKAAHVTPIVKIPIDGAGFRDQLRKGYRLAGRPVRLKSARGPALS